MGLVRTIRPTIFALRPPSTKLSRTAPTYWQTYSYDGNGNRLTYDLNGAVDNYNYGPADELQSVTYGSTTVQGFNYDAAGRVTSITTPSGTATLGYDYENRMTSYTGAGHSDTYTYNGLNARVSKVDGSGTFSMRRDGASPTDPLLNDGQAEYTPGVSRSAGGSSIFTIQDRLGSMVKQQDSSENETYHGTTDAFGNTNFYTGTSVGPFGFAGSYGYQGDADIYCYLCGNREYDPSIGRFLTRDPVKDGQNWYDYCSNNPLRFVDPSGLYWLTLPKDPSGLPPGWELDTSHGAGRGEGKPGSERWISPDGKHGLEYDPAKPGEGGEKEENHWHKLGPRKKRVKDTDGNHLKPGERVWIGDEPNADKPEPSSWWDNVNWGEVGRRTLGVVVVAAGVTLIIVTAGAAAPEEIPAAGGVYGLFAAG